MVLSQLALQILWITACDHAGRTRTRIFELTQRGRSLRRVLHAQGFLLGVHQGMDLPVLSQGPKPVSQLALEVTLLDVTAILPGALGCTAHANDQPLCMGDLFRAGIAPAALTVGHVEAVIGHNVVARLSV